MLNALLPVARVAKILTDGVIPEVPPGLGVQPHKHILDGPQTGVFVYQTIPGSVEALQVVVCMRFVLNNGIILNHSIGDVQYLLKLSVAAEYQF